MPVTGKQLLRNLAALGVQELNALQEMALEASASGLVFLTAPTGSGKTLAFLLAAGERLCLDGKAPCVLVVTPTRELAVQTAGVARKLYADTGVTCGALYGQMTPSLAKNLVASPPRLLCATPGRLIDALRHGKDFLRSVSLVVVDEAQKLSESGFRDNLEAILLATSPESVWLVSATDGPELRTFVARHFDEKPVRVVASGPNRVCERFLKVEDCAAWHEIVRDCLVDFGFRKVLVFARRRADCQALAKELRLDGIQTGLLTAEVTQKRREVALEAFASGATPVLVATDVLARGIDVEGIDLVVSTGVPETPEDHIHRIGRTARYGKEGLALTFVSDKEMKNFQALSRRLGVSFPLANHLKEALP